MLKLKKNWYFLEYKGLNMIYFNCSKFGHTKENCKDNAGKGEVMKDHTLATTHEVTPKAHPLYGPWMQIPTRYKKNFTRGVPSKAGQFNGGSRFAVLEAQARKKNAEVVTECNEAAVEDQGKPPLCCRILDLL